MGVPISWVSVKEHLQPDGQMLNQILRSFKENNLQHPSSYGMEQEMQWIFFVVWSWRHNFITLFCFLSVFCVFNIRPTLFFECTLMSRKFFFKKQEKLKESYGCVEKFRHRWLYPGKVVSFQWRYSSLKQPGFGCSDILGCSWFPALSTAVKVLVAAGLQEWLV